MAGSRKDAEGGSKRKRDQKRARDAVHSENERQRRHTMNESFDMLETMVPAVQLKPTRTELLDLTIGYIEELKAEVNELRALEAVDDGAPLSEVRAARMAREIDRAAAVEAGAAAAADAAAGTHAGANAATASAAMDTSRRVALAAENQALQEQIDTLRQWLVSGSGLDSGLLPLAIHPLLSFGPLSSMALSPLALDLRAASDGLASPSLHARAASGAWQPTSRPGSPSGVVAAVAPPEQVARGWRPRSGPATPSGSAAARARSGSTGSGASGNAFAGTGMGTGAGSGAGTGAGACAVAGSSEAAAAGLAGRAPPPELGTLSVSTSVTVRPIPSTPGSVDTMADLFASPLRDSRPTHRRDAPSLAAVAASAAASALASTAAAAAAAAAASSSSSTGGSIAIAAGRSAATVGTVADARASMGGAGGLAPAWEPDAPLPSEPPMRTAAQVAAEAQMRMHRLAMHGHAEGTPDASAAHQRAPPLAQFSIAPVAPVIATMASGGLPTFTPHAASPSEPGSAGGGHRLFERRLAQAREVHETAQRNMTAGAGTYFALQPLVASSGFGPGMGTGMGTAAGQALFSMSLDRGLHDKLSPLNFSGDVGASGRLTAPWSPSSVSFGLDSPRALAAASLASPGAVIDPHVAPPR